MHEISLCQSMRRIIEDKLQSSSKKVLAVHLDLGELSCVDSRALVFGFAAVMKGSIAEDAELKINHIAAMGYCPQCASEVNIAQRFAACPVCQCASLELRSGEELQLTNLEVS